MISQNTSIPGKGKVPLNQKFALGLASAGANTLNGLLYGTILKYYTDVVGLRADLYGFVFLLFGIWNAINDPLFGYLSDRRPIKTGQGKRLPWMKTSIPFFLAAYFLLWLPSSSWSQALLFIFLLVCLYIYDTCFTIFVLNQCALSTGITDSADERASISLVSTYVNVLPGLLASFVPTFVLTSDWTRPSIIGLYFGLGILGTVMMIWGVVKVREPIRSHDDTPGLPLKQAIIETFRSRSFVFFVIYSFCMGGVAMAFNGFVPYIMGDILGVSSFQATIPALLTGAIMLTIYPFVWKINSRIGVRATLMIFLIGAIIGCIGILFVDNYYLMIPFFGLIQWGTSTHWLLLNTIVGDIADEDQIKTGQRREGMFFGVNALIAAPAQSVIVFIFTQIITFFGYVGTAETQTDAAITGLRLGIGLVPIFFLVLGFIMLYFYPLHGTRYRKMKEQLAQLK
jgi:GPH family glycoside/pentoside/hexuronide:cation symporter